MITALDFKSITLAALEVRPVSVTGSVFSCLTSTGQYWASFDGGPFIPLQGGIEIDNRPSLFTSVILRNVQATPLTLTFYCGTCAVTYSPITVQVVNSNAPTTPRGGGVQALGAGAAVAIPDTGSKRKQIVFSNLDDTALLYVQDAAGNTLGPVLASDTVTLESGGAFKLYNPNGAPVNYCVGEVYYV